MKAASPRIVEISWGRMVVEKVGTEKDFKLWPGGGRAWDWGETDTHHVPGIQPVDVEELLDNGSRIVVLSRGMLLMLCTCPETRRLLESKGVQSYVTETGEAANIYNRFVDQGEAVGGLFHSTC